MLLARAGGVNLAAQQSQTEVVSPHVLTLSITDVWKKMFCPHWHLYSFNWLPLINDPVTAWTMNDFTGTALISRQFPKGNGLNYALQVPCLVLISMATAFPVRCHSLQQSNVGRDVSCGTIRFNYPDNNLWRWQSITDCVQQKRQTGFSH